MTDTEAALYNDKQLTSRDTDKGSSKMHRLTHQKRRRAHLLVTLTFTENTHFLVLSNKLF